MDKFLQKKRNNKEEKIQKIKFNCEEKLKKIFEKDSIKKILNDLGNSTRFEDLNKFFQNLANHEYKSIKDKQIKKKEPISINYDIINFDPLFKNNYYPQDFKLIEKIFKRNSEEKKIEIKKNDNNENIINNNNNNILNDFNVKFEDIKKILIENLFNLHENKILLNTLKKEDVMKIIKLNSNFNKKFNINLINEIDKNLLSIILEFKNQNNLKDFFDILIFYLNYEFLLKFDEKDFIRFDKILNEITILLINLNKDNFYDDYQNDFINFINLIPKKINKNLLDFIINDFHKIYFKKNLDSIIDLAKNNNNINIIFPYIKTLTNIYKFYFNINFENTKDKEEKIKIIISLIDFFLKLTREQENKYILQRSVEFILSDIYIISNNEIDQYLIENFSRKKIIDFCIEGLTDLTKIEENNNSDINSYFRERFSLFFNLTKINNEIIKFFPEKYNLCCQKIRNEFEQYLKYLLNVNENVAEELIDKCGENCEEIIIKLIEIIYEKNKNFEYNKFFRKIQKYYKENNKYYKGILILIINIPINFFYQKENFIIDKINENNNNNLEETENEVNINNEIFYALNENEKVFEYFNQIEKKDIQNKIIFYCFMYFLLDNKDNRYLNIVKLFLIYFFNKIINDKKFDDIFLFTDYLNKYFTIFKFIEFYNFILDIIKNNINNNEDIKNNYLEQIPIFLNYKYQNNPEEFSDEKNKFLCDFIKNIINKKEEKLIKELALKKLNNDIKDIIRKCDLILFEDI